MEKRKGRKKSRREECKKDRRTERRESQISVDPGLHAQECCGKGLQPWSWVSAFYINGRMGGRENVNRGCWVLHSCVPSCPCYSLMPPLAYSLKTWGRWSPASLRDPGPPTKAPGERFPGLREDLLEPCSTSSAAVNYSWHSPKVAAFTVSPVLIHKERTSKVDTFWEDLEEFAQGQ